jgi:hypothetical protein
VETVSMMLSIVDLVEGPVEVFKLLPKILLEML